MMPTECEKLIETYIKWLREQISVVDLGNACEITTPFLDRHNDRIQIYAVHENGGYRLTDDGYILNDLEASGCQLATAARKQILETILNGFGVRHHEGELFVEASAKNFAQRKHALVQAMLAVNDMFMTAKHRVTTLFWEDVSHYLESHEVRFSPNVEFTGKTGFVHKFDFVIPKSRSSPERLIRAINNPSRESTTNVLFSWTDTREVRAKDSMVFVILNDQEKEIGSDFTSAFHEYDVQVIPWSEREEHIRKLAA